LLSGCSLLINKENTLVSDPIYDKTPLIEKDLLVNPSVTEVYIDAPKNKSTKEDTLIPVHPEIWSQYSPYGKGWEFKVNCFGNYSLLEECFLWRVDEVLVVTPNGSRYFLNKDFNLNNYSGEITRRWVLYGPANDSLPESGTYVFEYTKNKTIIYRQNVSYIQSSISYPTMVQWEQRQKNLYVRWNAPQVVDKTMWYKVIVWNEFGTPSLFISKVFSWNATDALLEAVPFTQGGNYSLNVALFFPNGYAHSEYVMVRWK